MSENPSQARRTVLRPPVVLAALNYYKRSDALYQLTKAFCRRFLDAARDRTVDQMVQAARSTKQNIVEGHADGETSAESELKLLGVARGSVRELIADYADWLAARGLAEWKGGNPRFDRLHRFCREHPDAEAYRKGLEAWSGEEMANCALCLGHMVDKALTTVIARKDGEFVAQGGIRERMTAARLGARRDADRRLDEAERAIAALRQEVSALREEVRRLAGKR